MSTCLQNPAWYAVRTRSNFEKKVPTELDAKGIETLLPSFSEVREWKDRKKVVDQPLFPGCLFSRILDAGEARLNVLKVPGAMQILDAGVVMEPVPDNELEAIRALLLARVSYFAHPFLREGAIRGGPLKGVEGQLDRFKNQDRLVLSIPLLARSVATEVEASDVQVVRQSR